MERGSRYYKKKKDLLKKRPLYLVDRMKLFLSAFVALVEFVHATCGVDEFYLSCVERVGGVGNFDFYQGVVNTFDFDGFPGVYA